MGYIIYIPQKNKKNAKMDAIKKKMQAMKLEKDNAMDRADACEQQAKDANLRAERVSTESSLPLLFLASSPLSCFLSSFLLPLLFFASSPPVLLSSCPPVISSPKLWIPTLSNPGPSPGCGHWSIYCQILCNINP